MAADVLEFTSHGYNGYVYNADNERVPFMGYRADCINNFAIDFLHGRKEQTEPFFLFISQIEPHHQNDRRRYEGPDGSRAQFADFQPPGDLAACSRACAQGTDVSNWRENYPDYLGCCHSLDYNVGRLVDTLKEQGMWENTILVYTADHGSHFLTRGREAEYKRTCHDASIHIPLIITGPGFTGGNVVRNVVSLLDVSATLLACAGIERPEGWRGRDLRPLAAGRTEGWEDVAFLQISESRVGRAIRTPDYTYAVRAEGDGYRVFASDVYYEEFFYVLKDDPFQQNNLAADSAWAETRAHLAELLQCKMVQAGERPPEIRPFRAW
ncbi:MAG: sulfatase-like hydrolase/transferase [Ruthenibacterium lactatiformans]